MTDDDPPDIEHDDEHSAVQESEVEREILGKPAKRPRKESKESRIARECREADDFWRAALNTIVGRRELWRLIMGEGGAHAFKSKFAFGQYDLPDGNAAWYARGEQDFGLRLYHNWLRLDPVAVHQMHIENDPRFMRKPEGA